MASARLNQGLGRMEEIRYVVLERKDGISIIPQPLQGPQSTARSACSRMIEHASHMVALCAPANHRQPSSPARFRATLARSMPQSD